MDNNPLFSSNEFDVHPYEWVEALLSEYKTLREKSGITTNDPDSESLMIIKVKTLIEQAHEIRMNNERKQNQYIDYVQV